MPSTHIASIWSASNLVLGERWSKIENLWVGGWAVMSDHFGPFLIVVWWNFDQNLIKPDESHWKTKFLKDWMKFDIRNMFFESNYHEKVHLKYMKIMIFSLKFIIFDQFCNKNSPSGGPPTGSHLGRWARLRRTAARGLNGDLKIDINADSYNRILVVKLYTCSQIDSLAREFWCRGEHVWCRGSQSISWGTHRGYNFWYRG